MKFKTHLSVNLNKIALIRNSRGENAPNLIEVAQLVIKAGCHGITLHPREDERHATLKDVTQLIESGILQENNIELNVEGNLRDDLIENLLINSVSQFTVVPVTEGEKTTTRGWRINEHSARLSQIITLFKPSITRISLFIEPDLEVVDYAYRVGVDAVEFHTKWYAESFAGQNEALEINRLQQAAKRAKGLGLRVHLGHDLNLKNLPKILEATQPDEVSIGHALIVEALLLGLPQVVGQYNQLFEII